MGLGDRHRGPRKTLTYEVIPVLGTGPGDLALRNAAAATIDVRIPRQVEDGIGTYFNRAVVSSQSFSSEFGKAPSGKKLEAAMDWLANGMQEAIPDFLETASDLEAAIYHLTDRRWVMPALQKFREAGGRGDLVYYLKPTDDASKAAADMLAGAKFAVHPRTKANIMHDKFIVRRQSGKPQAVLAGSANFTPEAITAQANVLHTFASPELARLYAAREELLRGDPTLAAIAPDGEWSKTIPVEKAKIRVFFSPESGRTSIDAVVKAVEGAKSSVIFCLFSPTDAPLLDALLAAGDEGKIMYGLLNSIADPTKKRKTEDPTKAGKEASPAAQVQVTVFNRSRKDRKVVAYNYFRPGSAPAGFLPEFSAIDTSAWSTNPPPKGAGKKGGGGTPAVHVHHKFLVIDADTDSPTIYTGSANMSNNSLHNNDENLLEIKDAPALAGAYFAEFMRLYGHYRARALWNQEHPPATGAAATAPKKKTGETLVLKRTRQAWAGKAYQAGTPEFLSRTRLA
ncbi:MAG TPA: phospholipase D-like domain-containing protein [Thermoanaerobaculia bacterium]|nr:phospholipase D-like domain-containing protein [Thermoanaerobaculia bacterium]